MSFYKFLKVKTFKMKTFHAIQIIIIIYCLYLVDSQERQSIQQVYYLFYSTWRIDVQLYVCSYGMDVGVYLQCEKNDGTRAEVGDSLSIHGGQCGIMNTTFNYNYKGYCRLESNRTVAMTVFSLVGTHRNAFVPLPVNRWEREYYFIISWPNGFIVGISEINVVVMVWYSWDRSKESYPVPLQKLQPFQFMACFEVQPFGNKGSGEVKLEGGGRFGIFSGLCRRTDQERITVTVIPVANRTVYEYYTFCLEEYSCDIILGFSSNDTITTYNETSSLRLPNTRVRVTRAKAYDFIQSTSPLHIEVHIYMIGENSKNAFPLTSCIIVPVYLFQSVYIWSLPSETTDDKLIIICKSPLGQLLINDKKLIHLLSNTLHEIKTIKKDTKILTSVFSVFYRNPTQRVFRLVSTTEEAFGCYAIGMMATAAAYLVPVGIARPDDITRDTSLSTTPYIPCNKSQMQEGDRLDNDCDGYVDEEMNNTKDDDNDGSIDEDLAPDTENDCLPGWFGSQCDKMCHCQESNCRLDGECRENFTCSDGYFGTKCQYKDAVTNATVSQEELKYRSPVKCQQNFAAVSPLTIHFYNKTRISLIQIEAVSKDNLFGLSFAFNQSDETMAFYIGGCHSRRDVYANDITLIVYCNLNAYVYQLNVSFDNTRGPRRLCAVYVSQGRNVALRKHTHMSSLYVDSRGVSSRSSLSVDGLVENGECASTANNDEKSMWTLTFPWPIILEEIVVYFGFASHSKKVIVHLIGEGGKLNESFSVVMSKTISLITTSRTAVNSIAIRLQRGKRTLIICEVEAYGECAPPLYGPDCDDICSISCTDQVCSYEGYCRQCSNRTRGTYCFDGCSQWCEEYVETTNATQGPLQPPTGSPYSWKKGFAVENFWYYTLIIAFLLCILCINGADALGSSRRSREIILNKIEVEEANTEFFSEEISLQGFESSSSVDAVRSAVKSKSDYSSAQSSVSLK